MKNTVTASDAGWPHVRASARPACGMKPDMVLMRNPIIFSQQFNSLYVALISIAWI